MGRTAAAVALALSLSLLAVGCSKDPGTPAYWEDQLDAAQRPSEKVRVLETLRSSKRLDKRFAPMLNARLASEKSPETRAVIARALGELKDPSSVEPLAAALDVNTADGATSRMNAAIAQALGDIKDPRGATALISLLRSRDDYVRQDAIGALGELRAQAAVPTLVELALDDKSPPAVNRRAIVALGDIGDPRAVPTLLKAMFKQRGNAVFASEASFSLFQIGKPAADALTAVLEGKDRDLAAWARANDVVDAVVLVRAAESLGDFRATSAEPALVKQLSYKTSAPEQTLYARMAAASTLGKMRSAAGPQRAGDDARRARAARPRRVRPRPGAHRRPRGDPGAAALGSPRPVGGAPVRHRRAGDARRRARSADHGPAGRRRAQGSPPPTASATAATSRSTRWPRTG